MIKLEAEKASQQSDMFKLFESGEKYVMIVNSLENRVKLMEDQIKEGITSKSKELKQQNIVNTDQKCEPPSVQQKEIIMESKRPKLECNICRREFKNKNTLQSHDEKFHVVKGVFGSGSISYKCDNCNKKFTEKSSLENHIDKDHMKCSTCKKVFPTINSLNTHITAVHDNVKIKHKLEKEPSLKMRKILRAT